MSNSEPIEREYDPDRKPPHPGGILADYMEADGWTQTDLADVMNVSRSNLNKVINGNAGIGPKMGQKLSIVFDTDPRFWLKLDMKYQIWKTREENRVELEKVREDLEEYDGGKPVPA